MPEPRSLLQWAEMCGTRPLDKPEMICLECTQSYTDHEVARAVTAERLKWWDVLQELKHA